MTNNRIIDHPVLGKIKSQETLTFTFDGEIYEGYKGDTIASALMANGVRMLRVHEETGTARGIYCNIGHCFECRVTVNHIQGVRACLKELTADMIIESGKLLDELPRTYTEFAKKDKINEKGDADV